MIKCILLVTLLSLVFADNLSSMNKLEVLGNYQMGNYTGTAITSEMVTNYYKLINNAYSFFGNDTRLTSEYISTQLDNSYGWTYSVVILLANETVGSWFIYNVGGNMVVCWTKVNTYQPNWVYIIWPRYKYSGQTVDYIGGLGKGSGIDSTKETVIRNIIKAQEETVSACGCYSIDMRTITDRISTYDGASWSIICKKFSSTNFYSRLQSYNHQYIQLNVNTNKCEYVLVSD